MKKKTMKENISKALVKAAKVTAKVEANTSCAFLGYQIKESDNIKKLRKF